MTFRFWYFWEEVDRKIIGVGRWINIISLIWLKDTWTHANMHENKNILLRLTYTYNCKVYFNNSTTSKIMLCNNNNSIFLFVIPFNPHSNFTANSLLFFHIFKEILRKENMNFPRSWWFCMYFCILQTEDFNFCGSCACMPLLFLLICIAWHRKQWRGCTETEVEASMQLKL